MRGLVLDLKQSLEGTRGKQADVSDGLLNIRFKSKKKQSAQVGVDIKFSASGNTAKYVRNYTKQRPVDQLKNLFAAGELEKVTYLLSNMYYLDSSNSDYNSYMQDIADMAALLSGLASILPPKESMLDFNNPRMIANTLTGDRRMFVVINSKMYLMSTFLRGAHDSLLGSEL
jgi:hypothetical protein